MPSGSGCDSHNKNFFRHKWHIFCKSAVLLITVFRVRELVRGVWDLYASFVTLSDTCIDLSVSRSAPCMQLIRLHHIVMRTLNDLFFLHFRSLVNLCSASEQAATKCVNDIVDGTCALQCGRALCTLNACRSGLRVRDAGLCSSCCLWPSARDVPVRHQCGSFDNWQC